MAIAVGKTWQHLPLRILKDFSWALQDLPSFSQQLTQHPCSQSNLALLEHALHITSSLESPPAPAAPEEDDDDDDAIDSLLLLFASLAV